MQYIYITVLAKKIKELVISTNRPMFHQGMWKTEQYIYIKVLQYFRALYNLNQIHVSEFSENPPWAAIRKMGVS